MQKKAKVNRILTAFCVLIAAVLLLAACGGGDATTAAPKDTTAKQQESKAPEKTTAAAEKPSSGVKLTLVNWEGDQMNAAVREALAAYSKEAGFEVELQAAPLGDYKTSLNSMIMAGEAPSIYQSGHD
ncbi:MAG: hypothetical protein QM296_13600 [Bacillota bacterium]|nr:hypothetical protein [Bacillota bacterium]